MELLPGRIQAVTRTLKKGGTKLPSRRGRPLRRQWLADVTTVALFHHPDNAGQPRIFSMINPFAYLSATQNLDQAPLEYRRGETFTVRHLVTVTPRRLTTETLERRYQRWIQ
jgi:hypothetical protein